MATVPNWLPKLLEGENLQKYHAYFDYFHHNHKAQGAVALSRLGASYDRVQRHCKVKNDRCGFPRLKENEVLALPTEVDSLKSNDIQDYKGANVGFFRILEYFTDLYDSKYGKNIKKMIKGELSTILDAPLTSLFHGIIQVAYGYVSGADSVGTWSLRQIIHLLDYKEAMMTIRGQYLVMYATITAPEMTKNPEDYWTGDTVDQSTWDQIIQEAFNKDHDDHVFKVIQILYEAWKSDPGGPDSKTYIAGARMSLDSDFNVDGAGFEHGILIPHIIP